jgi:glycerol kinase
LAESVPDSGGVNVVPAFTGLGSPWWDPYARGSIIGITRGTTKAHIARAVVDAMVHQTRDAIDAMTQAGGVTLAELRVDGGASVMDAMLQRQSDALGVPVLRPTDHETTALGAAYLAGLAEGVWANLDEISSMWALDKRFEPQETDNSHAQWLRAVERSRSWASPES